MRNQLIIVGSNGAGTALASELICRNPKSVIGFVEDEQACKSIVIENNNGGISIPVLGHSKNLLKIVQAHGRCSIVLATPNYRKDHLLNQIVKCYEEGVPVYEMPDYYEKFTQKIPVEHVDHEWLVPDLTAPKHNLYMLFHDIMNYVLSLAGFLFVFLPLFPLIALAIKIDSKGPVFYQQNRVGRKGRIFKVIKYRTMIRNAENGKAKWAQNADVRITRIGRLLRRFRFDELPQFFNVLLRDMALIGPRPERPEFVGELAKKIPFYNYRHLVRPGLSGWAQINYRYGNSDHDALNKLQYDLYWIKNRSFWLDLKIIFRSVKVMLTGFGAV